MRIRCFFVAVFVVVVVVVAVVAVVVLIVFSLSLSLGLTIVLNAGVGVARLLKDNPQLEYLAFWNCKLDDETACRMVCLDHNNHNNNNNTPYHIHSRASSNVVIV